MEKDYILTERNSFSQTVAYSYWKMGIFWKGSIFWKRGVCQDSIATCDDLLCI